MAPVAAASYEIVTPPRPGRLAGLSMAGFCSHADDLVDIEVVPYPAVTLFIDLGEGLLVADDGGHQERDCVVAGFTASRVQGQRRDVECLQLRLSPTLAHATLGAGSGLRGTVLALEDLWGRDATRFQERLRAAESWPDRFALAEAALGGRSEAGRAADPEVAFAWRQMTTSRGRTRIERLATHVGWSRKRLWSRFGSQVGLTPKRAAQLIRFDHAAHRLAAGHSAAVVAAEGGYADQSHLHREVMTFAGVTPAAVAVAPWLAVDPAAWSPPARR
jgi:AraC-like DNA-binding protein